MTTCYGVTFASRKHPGNQVAEWYDTEAERDRAFAIIRARGQQPSKAEVYVEPEPVAGLTRRVFRRTPCGALEWTAYADWRAEGLRARFFGYASRDLPATLS